MTQKVVRYGVYNLLGAGGARLGSFRTLDEAKKFANGKSVTVRKDVYVKIGQKFIRTDSTFIA